MDSSSWEKTKVELTHKVENVGKASRLRQQRRQEKRSGGNGPGGPQQPDFGVEPGGGKISMWAVGFLDLLGYQEDLEATDVFPLPPKDEALELFRLVVNRRLAMVEGPRVLLAAAASTLPPIGSLSAADEQLRKHLSTVRVATTGFSDSVFLQTPLDDIPGKAPMVALSELVMVSALSLLGHLSIGSPIRGGIDVAAGMLTGGQLHSAAIAKAVRLEKAADYPRILVGKRFLDYLRDAMTIPDDADRAYLTHKRLATELSGILYTDPLDPPGSPPGIDYLGLRFRALMENTPPQMVVDIWRFANTSYAKFKDLPDDGSQKKRKKYERLIAYIKPRLEVWGLNESS